LNGRIYLCVPFEERRQATQVGASYDPGSLSCYVEKGRFDAERLKPWLPTFDVRPDPLPGSSWYDNVRSAVSQDEWRRLKKATYECYGHRCACCGDRGPEWPVECHEVFSFDDRRGVQRLEHLVALCPPCHEVNHIGLASTRGRFDVAISHMMAVTGRSRNSCRREAVESMRLANVRSRRKWTVDLSYVKTLAPAPPAVR
jgi:hypothetical protein